MEDYSQKEFSPMFFQPKELSKELPEKPEDVQFEFPTAVVTSIFPFLGGIASALTKSVLWGFIAPVGGNILYSVLRDKLPQSVQTFLDRWMVAFDIGSSLGAIKVGGSLLKQKKIGSGLLTTGMGVAGLGLSLNQAIQMKDNNEAKEKITKNLKQEVIFPEIDRMIAKLLELTIRSILDDIEKASIVDYVLEDAEIIDEKTVREQGENPEVLREFLKQVLEYYNNNYGYR